MTKTRTVVTNEIWIGPHALEQAALRHSPYLTREEIDREIRAGILAGRQATSKPKWCRLWGSKRSSAKRNRLLAGQFCVWDEAQTTCWVITRQAVGPTHRYIVATTMGRTAPQPGAGEVVMA